MTVGLTPENSSERLVSFGSGLAPIPERLLLAHARGEVLFIAGAGISEPAGHPLFRELVLEVYKKLDNPVYNILKTIPSNACNLWKAPSASLDHGQVAEIQRFISRDYDVVLGMLERRMDTKPGATSKVRQVVCEILDNPLIKPADIHKTLMRLADRGEAATVVTTNFDLLLEKASRNLNLKIRTYSLGGIPRADRSQAFSGVLHIHGSLEPDKNRASDLVLSDRDFGEFYLRRRVVPDFIYDAARLFHLVLIGYSANDPPMRYLLNAVAADGTRFTDLKERFAFIGTSGVDTVQIEDWKGRGITPIPYDSTAGHASLGKTLGRWMELSSNNKDESKVRSEIRRIIKKKRVNVSDADRDLFDYFFRCSNPTEREVLASYISKHNGDIGWLEAILSISVEKRGAEA